MARWRGKSGPKPYQQTGTDDSPGDTDYGGDFNVLLASSNDLMNWHHERTLLRRRPGLRAAAGDDGGLRSRGRWRRRRPVARGGRRASGRGRRRALLWRRNLRRRWLLGHGLADWWRRRGRARHLGLVAHVEARDEHDGHERAEDARQLHRAAGVAACRGVNEGKIHCELHSALGAPHLRCTTFESGSGHGQSLNDAASRPVATTPVVGSLGSPSTRLQL